MIRIVDEARILERGDKRFIQSFLLEQCYSRKRDRDWLEKVIFRNDGPSDYFGYWACHLIREGAFIKKFKAVIVLNTFYLMSARSVLTLKTLSHEYGHNWTIGYLINLERIEVPTEQRAPWLYYRIRHLNPKKFKCDYDSWSQCDKEVLAEDYRCLLTSRNEDHAMVGLKTVYPPTSEVREYIERLGRSTWG